MPSPEPSPHPPRLFAYGTLMCEQIMCEVSGLSLAGSPARLHDYRRLQVRGELYPGLVQMTGFQSTGQLYQGVTAQAWQRLDRFEGKLYQRAPVQVISQDELVEAQTYLIHPAHRDILEPRDWNYEEFLRHRARFELDYRGWLQLLD